MSLFQGCAFDMHSIKVCYRVVSAFTLSGKDSRTNEYCFSLSSAEVAPIDLKPVTWGTWKLKNYIPTDFDQVKDIAVSQTHAVLLLQDFTIVAYGENGSGQLNIPPISRE